MTGKHVQDIAGKLLIQYQYYCSLVSKIKKNLRQNFSNLDTNLDTLKNTEYH